MTGDHNGRITDYTAIVCGFSHRAGAKSGSVAFEAQTAPTLSASRHDASVICIKGNAIDRKPQNGGNGLGVDVDICPTLNTVDRHAVAYCMTTGSYMQCLCEEAPTLQARDYKDPPVINEVTSVNSQKSTVRRLTPLECERLQGYPDGWTRLCPKDKLDGAAYDFWRGVMITDKQIRGKKYNTNITEAQLTKWYNKLECDAGRYKALGNSLAIPCALRVVGYIADYERARKEATDETT